MISPEQIRAARALLDWSTATLAERAGLTVNGVNKIERKKAHAQKDTLEKIQACLEEAGVSFLPGGGLRRKSDILTITEGPDFRRKIIGDVYETLKETGGDYLMAHADETNALEDVGETFLFEELHKRWEAGIVHRFLVRADDQGMVPPYRGYHFLPEKYFTPYPLEIYGPKVGFSTRAFAPKSVIVHDAEIAESVRRLFNFVWDHTEAHPLATNEEPLPSGSAGKGKP